MSGNHVPLLSIVDDDPEFLELLQTLVERLGYRTRAFLAPVKPSDISEIVEADMVLTDLFMPQFDGIELLRAIRRKSETLPVIVVSGAESEYGDLFLRMAVILGAHATISKTDAARALPVLIRRALALDNAAD